jgi:peptidoglycan/xylan/chitin deacetylase (PgdA/CDA1 family)
MIYRKSLYLLLLICIPVFLTASDAVHANRNDIVTKYGKMKPHRWGMRIPGVKTHFKTRENVIALTFDACGGTQGKGFDRDLVDYLTAEKIPATFFVTSSWISYNPRNFEYLMQNPLFEIENHGFRHRPASVTGASAWGIRGTANAGECFDEVELSARNFEKLTGHRPRFYRSGTAYYDDVAVSIIRETGQYPVNFSKVTADADRKLTLKRVVAFIRDGTRKGAVIIMHCNHPGGKTLPALKITIPEMRAKGYSFVKLEDVADNLE